MYLVSVVFLAEVICYNLYAFLLKRYSATFLAFAGCLYPIFGALLGWFFFHEKITYNFFISVTIVSAALYLYYIAEQEKRRATGSF